MVPRELLNISFSFLDTSLSYGCHVIDDVINTRAWKVLLEGEIRPSRGPSPMIADSRLYTWDSECGSMQKQPAKKKT